MNGNQTNKLGWHFMDTFCHIEYQKKKYMCLRSYTFLNI